MHTIAAVLASVGGGFHLTPDVGAPTAMKYGGSQLGSAFVSFAGAMGDSAAVAQEEASALGAGAAFQRRDEDWKHQAELAARDLDQLDRQIAAAEIRRDIAIESQKVHERSIEQTQEIFDLLRDRFTSLGLFTWLSAELQKLHRVAFNAALGMARLAEQACQFEHPDDGVGPRLTGDYWDGGNAGLLAGDRLLLDLHNLERSYVETNYRTLEIEQSFSLARFDPDGLSKLKTDCECSFEIPEWYFDLSYPGHYRRRIKAVRLTIPCVVGPHTNVAATLRLTGSHIRRDPRLDSSVPVPLRHTTTIAASMGQSDPGVFEFNFRDERYMPFEGAGVNSQWQLSLPKAVKAFDYSTINDVILRISYTAEEDSGLRTTVESTTGVLTQLTDEGITRTLSLRSDFPDAWSALVAGAPHASTTIDVGEVCVPFLLSSFDLAMTPFDLLVGKLDVGATYAKIDFDDNGTTEAGADATSGLYRLGRTKAVDFVGTHTIRITDWGSVAAPGPADALPRLDDSKVADILLRAVLKRKPTMP